MPGLRPTPKRAFTLLELAIVLIVLGLIAGGILAGQSLIHAAEINSVVSDATRYTQASVAFRAKYFARPGDMSNATPFWGYAGNSTAGCVSNSGITAVSTPGTCDGNGDDRMTFDGAPGGSNEDFRAWQQLALAGLIEGGYSGNSGPGSGVDSINGVNVPGSKVAAAGWGYGYYDNSAGLNLYSFNYDMTNWLTFGAMGDHIWADDLVLTSLDALNIDTKLDDGKPGTGSVLANAMSYGGCTNYTGSADRAAVYTPGSTGAACALLFKLPD